VSFDIGDGLIVRVERFELVFNLFAGSENVVFNVWVDGVTLARDANGSGAGDLTT